MVVPVARAGPGRRAARAAPAKPTRRTSSSTGTSRTPPGPHTPVRSASGFSRSFGRRWGPSTRHAEPVQRHRAPTRSSARPARRPCAGGRCRPATAATPAQLRHQQRVRNRLALGTRLRSSPSQVQLSASQSGSEPPRHRSEGLRLTFRTPGPCVRGWVPIGATFGTTKGRSDVGFWPPCVRPGPRPTNSDSEDLVASGCAPRARRQRQGGGGRWACWIAPLPEISDSDPQIDPLTKLT